ncbi:MAG: hypothetical protein JWN15_1012 [Firmicutes bacterium]|nr:hypothetical protein [Bacillota bacterium]
MAKAEAAEPNFPLQARLISRRTVEVTARNMLGFQIAVEEPAQGSMSAKSTRALGQQSMKNGLGTHRPAKVLLGLDSTNQYMLMLPTHSQDPDGTEVRYNRSRGLINLITIFHDIDRLVPAGIKEYYGLEATSQKITVGTATGFGLVMKLEPEDTAPITPLTDEQKAVRKAKADARRRKQQGGPSVSA